MLRPAGGYKGYGLAFMFECFTSLMAGNALLAPHILPERAQDKPKAGAQNSFVAAVDISMFSDVDEMRAEVDELVRAEKSLPTQDGVEERKSTRLNSSHVVISYAVFGLNKKKQTTNKHPYTHDHTSQN